VLILDEATSSLDLQRETVIERALDRLLEGRSAILIAHRLTTAQRADRIVVIDEGGIVRFLNHEAESILGIKRRKVLDKPLASELLLVPFREAMAAARRRVVHLEALNFLNSAGEGFCMGFRAVPVKGGLDNPLGSLGMLLPGDFKGQGLDAIHEKQTDPRWVREVSAEPKAKEAGHAPGPAPAGPEPKAQA